MSTTTRLNQNHLLKNFAHFFEVFIISFELLDEKCEEIKGKNINSIF
jgi:hypothetical protein